MNDITTPSSVDKITLATRIVKNSTQLLEDYVLWHECGWSDDEFGALLGISAKTVRNRFLADARSQGLLPAAQNNAHKRRTRDTKRFQPTARLRARPVENVQPIPVASVTTDLPPFTHHVRHTSEPEPVLVSATVVESDAERDYERALECIDELFVLTKRYFHKGWDKRKWFELAGECRTIEACCNNHCGSKYGQETE